MDGRTFLPLRTLADLVGLPVDFDPATNTAILGSRDAGPVRRSLNTAAPAFDRGYETRNNSFANNRPSSASQNSVQMSGTIYSNVTTFRNGNSNLSDHPVTVFTLHNLNGQFRRLTGYIGRVDESGQLASATLNIVGDGRLLQSIEVDPMALPTPVSVFVEDVRQLRIELVFSQGAQIHARHGCDARQTIYALYAFVE
jgi:hypothetical protein